MPNHHLNHTREYRSIVFEIVRVFNVDKEVHLRHITIQAIYLHPISIPLVEPLKTSFGVEENKDALLVELITTKGLVGWGEVSVGPTPGYGPETMKTAHHILEDFIIPIIQKETIQDPTDLPKLLASIRGHKHTKAGLEAAVWGAYAKENELPLADLFATFLGGGQKPRNAAVVGVSIGIQSSIEETIKIIEKRLAQGYGRIKLKIMPNWDLDLVQAVRERYPEITLMVDANSAYSRDDFDHLAKLDRYNLLMIEQPLNHEDILEHSLLQRQMTTSLCLDESVKSTHDLELALEIGACRILNLKPARVGGFTESLRIYRICVKRDLPLWIGGMLETGVGRAANLAFASFPGVTLPSDISATDRYFDEDITEPAFYLGPDSTIAVPEGMGIGVEVQLKRLERAKVI